MRHRSSGTISVIVADDDPAILDGVADILESNADIKVVALCNSAAAANQTDQKPEPHVAVLDIDAPDARGLEALSKIASGVITGAAKELACKELASKKLIECIKSAAAEQAGIAPEMHYTVKRSQRRSAKLRSLTLREREIVEMVAQGHINKDIAHRLGISEATVKIHLHNIFKKMRLANRTALAAFVIAHRDELADVK
jgi:DNA-binding NarL/FixJ family response regulator